MHLRIGSFQQDGVLRRHDRDDDIIATIAAERAGPQPADEAEAQHQQRREQEQQEGRRHDDRQEIAPRDHEGLAQGRAHLPSPLGISSIPAALPTIWTKASCRPGRSIDSEATP